VLEIRPGKRILTPGDWMRVIQPRGGAAADWWDPDGDGLSVLAAYQPQGAASYATSKTNVANPGIYDATEGAAPSWSAGTGWSFNGSSHYLNSTVVPTASEQSWTFIVQFANASGSAGLLFGRGTSGIAHTCISPNQYYLSVLYTHGWTSTRTPYMSAGNLCMAGRACYRNGSHDATLGVNTNTGSGPVFIGAKDNTGFRACDIAAFAIYDVTLSADQVSAVAAAMAAL